MTFFDKKEDVLKIELTPYGRSLLSHGKLMPKYYAFFDDDVLYDASSIGADEQQDQIKERILNETPRLKPQRSITSVEREINSYEKDSTSARPSRDIQQNMLMEPLGSSDNSFDEAPGWNISFISGEIQSTSQFLSGSRNIRRVPQINSTIEYKMEIKNISNTSPVRGRRISPNIPASDFFSDGTYLDVLEEQIICKVLEEKGFNANEALEMEVFLIDDQEETLQKLKFIPREKTIVNGMIVEDEVFDITETTPEYVEYWLDIELDHEIPEEEICQGIRKLKSEDIHVDMEIVCPDVDGVDFDIYGTRVTDVEDC